MPGFVDTHRHMWQGFLRNVLPDGSLDDYRNVVQRTFGAKMTPDDVYAADLHQRARRDRQRRDLRARLVAHPELRRSTPTPASRACRSPACGRCSPMAPARTRPAGSWRSQPPNIPATSRGCASSTSPATISSSRSIWRPWRPAGGVARAVQGRARRRRAHHHPCRRRRVRPQRASWRRSTPPSALKDDTTYIHCCTLNDTEWKLIKDTGGTISIAGYVETLMGHGNPPTQKAIDLGIRPIAQRRRRDLGAERLLHPDAHGVLAAEERGLGAAPRRRQGRRQVPHGARGARIRHRRRRHAPTASRTRSAR